MFGLGVAEGLGATGVGPFCCGAGTVGSVAGGAGTKSTFGDLCVCATGAGGTGRMAVSMAAASSRSFRKIVAALGCGIVIEVAV